MSDSLHPFGKCPHGDERYRCADCIASEAKDVKIERLLADLAACRAALASIADVCDSPFPALHGTISRIAKQALAAAGRAGVQP